MSLTSNSRLPSESVASSPESISHLVELAAGSTTFMPRALQRPSSSKAASADEAEK